MRDDMAEYGLLFVLTRGTQWLDGTVRAIAGDPVLLWGGGAALLLAAIWSFRPSR
jgi:hypothetical protein